MTESAEALEEHTWDAFTTYGIFNARWHGILLFPAAPYMINLDVKLLTSGLQLWLDSTDPLANGTILPNGTPITTWYDKSGNLNNATGGVSPFYANNSIVFNGASFLDTTLTARPMYETIFVVFLMAAPLSGSFSMVGTNAPAGRGLRIYNNNLGYTVSGVGGYSNTSGGISRGMPTLVAGTILAGPDNGVATTFINGGKTISQSQVFTTYGGGTTRIGSGNDSDFFNGTISEVLIYNRALSTSERQRVEGYLAWKWRLSTSLPSTHAYYNSFDVVVKEIESLTNLPTFITSVNETNATETQFTINWSGGNNTTYYTYTINNSDVIPLDDQGVFLKYATFGGLTVGTLYSVIVTAYNSAGFRLSSTFQAGTIPSKPLSLNQNIPSINEFTINWSGVQGASSYTYTLNGITTVPTSSTSTSATFGGLTGGALYVVIVNSVNIYGYNPSAPFNATTRPTQPTSLNLTNGSTTGFTINWTGGLGATSFSYTFDGISKTPVSSTSNSATFSGLSPGTYYAIIVTANNSVFPSANNVSPTFNATTTPSQAVSLTPSNFLTTAFTISWTGGLGATSYTYTLNGSPATPSDDQGVANKYAIFTDLSPGTTYLVVVIGSNISGSTSSASFSISTVPSTPVSLTITNITSSGFRVNWSGGDGATSYSYQLNGQTVTASNDQGLQSKYAVFTGLLSGTTYNVIVTASNSGGFAASSNIFTGVELWLDSANPLGTGVLPAESSVLSTWYDLSPNAYNASAVNSPRYTSSGISFSGSYYKTYYTSQATTESIFVVFKQRTIGGLASLVDTSDNGGRAFSLINTNGPSLANSRNSWVLTGLNPLTANVTYMAECLYNTSGVSIYLNGTISSSNTTNPGFSAGVTYIGAGNHVGFPSVNWYLDGTISEVLVFNSVLNTTNRQLVEGYLAWKWAIQSSLPIAHPYYSTSPTWGVTTITTPSQPISLSLTNGSDTGFTINWTQGNGATSYSYTINGLPVTPSIDLGLTNKRATFNGLTIATSYQIVVTATNLNGSTSSSSFTAITTPSKPISLTATNIFNDGFTVSWSGGQGATSYIYTLNGSSVTPTSDLGVASKTAIFSGLTPNTTYSLFITAMNTSGTSTSGTQLNPTIIPGIQTWLDANDPLNTGTSGENDTSVTIWYDKSGKSNNMTFSGSSVTYSNASVNSLNTIFANGLTQGTISIPMNTFTSNYCGFIVLRNTSSGNTPNAIFNRTDLANYPAPLEISGGGDGKYYCGLPGGRQSLGVPTEFLPKIIGNNLIEVLLTTYASTGGTGNFNAYVNGFPITMTGGAVTGLNATDATTSSIYFGGITGSQVQMISNFCEIIIYNTNLSTGNRQLIEGYLAWKWGLQNKPLYSPSTYLSLITNATDTGSSPQTVTNNNVVFSRNNFKNSARFNNSTSTYLSIPFPYGTGSFTISYWFTATDGGYYNPWALSNSATSAGSYGINPDYSNGTQYANFAFSGGTLSLPTFAYSSGVGTWNHFAVTVNSSTKFCQLYGNGVAKTSGTGSGTLNNSTFLIIGKDGTNSRAFNGSINNFAVYNSALSSSQILDIYNSQLIMNSLGPTHPYNSAAPIMGLQVSTLPTIPSSFSLTNITDTGFTINWAVGSGANNYTFTLNTTPTVPSLVSPNSATFTGLLAGSIYSVIVTAINEMGLVATSAPYNAGTAPSKPNSLVVSNITGSSFRLAWSGGVGATGYIYNLNGASVTPSDDQGLSSKYAIFTGLTGNTSYNIYITATNSIGSTSSAVSLAPSFISGLQLWLDGNDPLNTGVAGTNNATLTTWYDKSGNSRNMVWAGTSIRYANSSINSLNTIHVNGTVLGTVSIPTGTFPSNYCGFIVVKNTTGFSTVFGRTDTNGWGLYDFYAGGTVYVATAVGNRITVGDPQSYFNTFTGYPMMMNFGLTNYSPTGGTGSYNHYYNGLPVSYSGTVSGINGADTISSNIYFGGRAGVSFNHQVNYCEILLFNTNITTTSRQMLEGYLAWKWGLQSVRPYMAQTILLLNENTMDTGSIPQIITNSGVSVISLVTNPSKKSSGNFPGNTYLSLPFNYGAGSFSITYWSYASSTGGMTAWSLSTTQSGASGTAGINAQLANGVQDFYLTFSGGIVNAGNWSTSATSGVWFQSVLTVNAVTGECKSYLNGVLKNTATGVGTLQNTAYLLIGKNGTNTQAFYGYINNFAVYNYVLTQAQITTIYNSESITNFLPSSHPYYSSPPLTGVSLTTLAPEPSSLSLTSVSTTGFTVNWSGTSGITSFTYTLNGVSVTPASSTSTSATFTGLSPGTAYAIIVSSVNSSGSSPSASFAGSTLPSQPTTLSSSSISTTAFTVSWTAGASATSYSYTLNGSSVTPSNDQGVASKRATFTGLSSGTTYAVIVTAINAFGSTASSSFNVLTTPGQPTSLNATNISTVGFTVNWSGASGATSYTYTIDGTTRVPASSTSTSATFSGLLPGTSYSVIVRAVNTSGSTASSSLSILILPSVPFNLTQTAASLTMITVSWLGGIGATSYTYTLNGSAATPSDDQGIASKYAVFTGLTFGSIYSIVVTAVNSSGSISSPPSVSNVSGAYLWIDGNDPLGSGTLPDNNSTVSILYDKSGNSRNLSVTSPAYPATFSTNSVNGLSNLLFANSVYRSATLTGGVFFPFDVYLVLKLNSVTAVGSICSISQSNSASSYNALTFSSSKWSNASESSSRTSATVASTTETSTSYILIQWSFGNSNFNIYRNGSQIAYTSTYTYTPPASLSFLLGLTADNTTTGSFNGAIAEIVAYNTLQSTTNRQYIEGALAWKWGIQSSLSASHPYFSARPSGVNLYTAPSAPTSLTLTNGSSTGFTINWTGASGATRFTYTLNGISTVPASTTVSSATFTGLTVATSYEVIVNAFNGPVANTSSPSFSAITLPSEITSLTASAITNTGFTVSWSGGLGATSYTYQLNGSLVTPSVDNSMTSKSVTFTGLTPATSYSLVINAINSGGSVSSVNIYGLSNLSGINVLQNWYDASDPLNTGTAPANGSTLASWIDKSSKANNLSIIDGTGTFASNSLNGRGTMSFSGSTYYRAVTANAPYPINVFIIVKLSALNRAHDVCSVATTGGDFNSLTFGEYTAGRWHNGSGGFARTPATVASSAETSTDFLLMHWSTANSNYYIMRNGVQISQTTSYTWTVPANLFFQLGVRTYGSTANNLSGSVAEVLTYNNNMSTQDRQVVEGYLAWKWGLQANLPVGHPYYTGTPILPIVSSRPASLNLQLWLDGKDPLGTGITPAVNSVLATWVDKSGNGFNATGVNSPTYTTTGINFNGSQSFTSNYTSFAAAESMFVVYTINNAATQSALLGTSSPGGRDFQSYSTTQGPSLARSGQVWVLNGAYSIASGQTYIAEVFYNSSGTSILVTGNASATNTTNPAFTAGTTLIGNTYNGFSFTGKISEIIVYNTVLSTTQRQQVESYLAWKWGIQANLPVAHPYYSAPYSVQGIVIPPAAPTSLASSETTATSFKISWSGSDGSTSYIYTLNGVTTVPSTDAGVASKFAIFTGLTGGISYTVIVTAVFSGVSTPSSSFTTGTAPSEPTSVTGSAITTTGFTVSWIGGTSATSYTYSLNGSLVTPSVDAGVANKTATFSGIAGDTSYIVLISATNTFGTTVGSNQFTPKSVSTLQNWYDAADPLATGTVPANGTTITSWFDKSGNARNTTSVGGTAITNNNDGYNFLNFSNSYYNLPTMSWMSGSGITLFMVETATEFPGSSMNFFGNSAGIFNGSLSFLAGNGYNGYFGSTNGQTANFSFNPPLTGGITRVWSFVFDNSTTTYTLLLNGTQTGTRVSTAPTIFINQLGTFGSSVAASYKGKMREIVGFSGNMSTTNRQNVEGYLAWKWGAKDNLASSHPYSISPPQSIATPPDYTYQILATGTPTSGTTPLYASYDNGQTWKPISNTISNTSYTFTGAKKIGWNGTHFVGGFLRNSNYTIAYSTNGTNWTDSGYNTLTDFKDVAYNNRWIAATAGPLSVSTTGASPTGWATGGLINVIDNSVSNVVWAGTQWVAMGMGGGNRRMLTSSDGTTWTVRESSLANDSTCMKFNNNTVLVCFSGSPILRYSTNNGTSFTNSTSAASVFTSSMRHVAWNGSMWVGVGTGTNTLGWSNDGITWTGLGTSIFSTSGNTVAWTGSTWIAGGSGTNSLAYSTNGTTWTGIGTSVFSTTGFLCSRILN